MATIRDKRSVALQNNECWVNCRCWIFVAPLPSCNYKPLNASSQSLLIPCVIYTSISHSECFYFNINIHVFFLTHQFLQLIALCVPKIRHSTIRNSKFQHSKSTLKISTLIISTSTLNNLTLRYSCWPTYPIQDV